MAPLRKRQFFSLQEVNQAMKKELEKLNNRTMKAVGKVTPSGI